MALLHGPATLSLRDIARLVATLEEANHGRWQRIVDDQLDDGQELLLTFFLSDEQGDNDENVESILADAERLLVTETGLSIPLRDNGEPWLVLVKYEPTPDFSHGELNICASNGLRNEPGIFERSVHGSISELAEIRDENPPYFPHGKRWRRRRGLGAI